MLSTSPNLCLAGVEADFLPGRVQCVSISARQVRAVSTQHGRHRDEVGLDNSYHVRMHNAAMITALAPHTNAGGFSTSQADSQTELRPPPPPPPLSLSLNPKKRRQESAARNVSSRVVARFSLAISPFLQLVGLLMGVYREEATGLWR